MPCCALITNLTQHDSHGPDDQLIQWIILTNLKTVTILSCWLTIQKDSPILIFKMIYYSFIILSTRYEDHCMLL
jgi:hypothetical protein